VLARESRVVNEIDAAGNEIEYYYEDGRGNMTRKVEKEKKPDGLFETYVTRYEYNSFHKVSKITDSLSQA
jgi:YD repeat-containing protein